MINNWKKPKKQKLSIKNNQIKSDFTYKISLITKMKEIIFPKSLKTGDIISIISPVGFLVFLPLQSTLNSIKSKVYDPFFGIHTLLYFFF